MLSTTTILNNYITTTSDSMTLNSNIRKFISFLKDLSNTKSLIDMNNTIMFQDVFFLSSYDLIENDLIDINIVKNRIKTLTQAFFKKQLIFDNIDNKIIFEELISYQRFNFFHAIFFKTATEYIIDNIICFIHYDRVSSILHRDEFEIGVIQFKYNIKYITEQYINSHLNGQFSTLNTLFTHLISYRTHPDFYTMFFDGANSILLDNVISDYNNIAQIVGKG